MPRSAFHLTYNLTGNVPRSSPGCTFLEKVLWGQIMGLRGVKDAVVHVETGVSRTVRVVVYPRSWAQVRWVDRRARAVLREAAADPRMLDCNSPRFLDDVQL